MTPVFVFGSNLDGIHGRGAALCARDYHGAIMGVAQGLQGNSYAIPTKGHWSNVSQRFVVLPLSAIQKHVTTFIEFATAHPQLQFELTAIGCGLAGYDPAHIAPMFRDAPDNVALPERFKRVLDQ